MVVPENHGLSSLARDSWESTAIPIFPSRLHLPKTESHGLQVVAGALTGASPPTSILNRGVIAVLGDSFWSRGLVLRVPSRENFLRGSICFY